MKLNIGSGLDSKPGHLNIDREPGPGVDLLADLSYGLPFRNDSIESVLASHVLEHIPEYEAVIVEAFRILEPGGSLEIRGPYGFRPCAYHVRFFNEETLDHFIIGKSPKSSLDRSVGFELVRLEVLGGFPLRYHATKYLGHRIAQRLDSVFKMPEEIRWILKKPGSGQLPDTSPARQPEDPGFSGP